MNSVKHTVYRVDCTMSNTLYTVKCEQFTVNSLQCILYNVHSFHSLPVEWCPPRPPQEQLESHSGLLRGGSPGEDTVCSTVYSQVQCKVYIVQWRKKRKDRKKKREKNQRFFSL